MRHHHLLASSVPWDSSARIRLTCRRTIAASTANSSEECAFEVRRTVPRSVRHIESTPPTSSEQHRRGEAEWPENPVAALKVAPSIFRVGPVTSGICTVSLVRCRAPAPWTYLSAVDGLLHRGAGDSPPGFSRRATLSRRNTSPSRRRWAARAPHSRAREFEDVSSPPRFGDVATRAARISRSPLTAHARTQLAVCTSPISHQRAFRTSRR